MNLRFVFLKLGWGCLTLAAFLTLSPTQQSSAYQVFPHHTAKTKHTLCHSELTRIILSKFKAGWMRRNSRDRLFAHAVIWEDSYSKGGGSYYAYIRNSKVKISYRKNATNLNPINWYKNACSFRRHFFNPYAKEQGLIMTAQETLNLIQHRAKHWSKRRGSLPKFARRFAYSLLVNSTVVAKKISGKQKSALWWAQKLWAKSIKYAKSKEARKRETSIHYLGRVIHLLQDMASPAHVLLVNHGGEYVGGPKMKVGHVHGIEPWSSLQPLHAPKGGWSKAIKVKSISEAFHKVSKFTLKQIKPFPKNFNTRLSTTTHPARRFGNRKWQYSQKELSKVLTAINNNMIPYALGILQLYEERSTIKAMDAKYPQSTKQVVGAGCTEHYQCNNGACGRESGAKSVKRTCCKSGRTTLHTIYNFCTQMPMGSPCWLNKMCASGLCKGNLHGVKVGTCAQRGKRKIGAFCTKHGQCHNGACGRETAAKGVKRTCCKSGGSVSHMRYHFCTKMPPGSDCWLNSMCARGTCEGNLQGVKKGRCK